MQTTLYLDTLEQFFSQPDLSPLSEQYREYSQTAGMEYLAKELYAHPTIKEVHVTIVLPAEKIAPDLEHKTKAALVRYCRARLKPLEQERQGLTVVGWVFVWFPLDFFLFGVRHYRLDKRIYEKLAHLRLTIRPGSSL
jgi:hypothetical protein